MGFALCSYALRLGYKGDSSPAQERHCDSLPPVSTSCRYLTGLAEDGNTADAGGALHCLL